jgi:predicted ATPase/DNA-binding CsgD family transcriptional regulator
MINHATPGNPPPTLEANPQPPHNLPTRTDPLIGRVADLETAQQLLLHAETQLLTLTGPGGVGKTRLALELARVTMSAFPDGLWFIDLSDVADASLVPITIARTLGLRDARRSALESLEQALSARRVLLILDNFEHVLDASSTITRLMATSPDVRVIVTSREALRLRFEQRLALEPLEYPVWDGSRQAEQIVQYPAVQLFLARVRLVLPEFVLDEHNAEVIARLCARLDGLPLALELVAARVNMFGPQTILERLGAGQSLPLVGAADGPARHGSLSAAMEWSYVLLEAQERALLRRLAVFEGGWSLEAAGGVVDAEGLGLKGLDGLVVLADRNLVRVSRGAEDQARFSMLRTIRDFALERLVESGELQGVRQRHAEFFLQFAEATEAEIRGPNKEIYLDQLEAEAENFWAALRWARETINLNLWLRLCGALSGMWFLRDYATEGRKWLAEALEMIDTSNANLETTVLAKAWRVAGELALTGGDFPEASQLLEQSLSLYRGLGDDLRVARVLLNLGNIAAFRGESVRAVAFFQEALALARTQGADGLRAHILGDLGIHYAETNDLDRADEAYQEALSILRTRDDQGSITRMTGRLGDLAIRRGDLDGARALLEENLPILRQLKFSPAIADALGQLAVIALLKGQPEQALEPAREALRLCVQIGQKHGIKSNLEIVTMLAAASGRAESAARLFGAIAVFGEDIGLAPDPFWDSISKDYLERARAALGETGFAEAWEQGQGWSLERALEEAFGFEIGSSHAPDAKIAVPPAPMIDPSFVQLSPREFEVLRVVARGLSNKEVAQELGLSAHTVKFHLNAVFNKLGCRTRAQAVRIAFDQGLIKPGDEDASGSG